MPFKHKSPNKLLQLLHPPKLHVQLSIQQSTKQTQNCDKITTSAPETKNDSSLTPLQPMDPKPSNSNTDLDDWQDVNPRKTKRNSPTSDQRNVKQKIITDYWLNAPKNNRYENLNPDENTDNENVLNDKEIKPPPIFVHGVQNMKPLTELLDQHTSNAYIIKLIGNTQLKIQLNDSKTYNKIINVLKEKQTEFHSYQHKMDRKFKVVLRNMHHSVDLTELTKEINAFGHKVLNIHNVKHRIHKTLLPMFFVDIEQKENNKDIYNIEFLMNSKIKIEPPHVKRDIPQCSTCQRYGHTKNFCNRRPRCVKCAGDHLTNQCERKEKKNEDVLCVNCNGNHPANYKGCTVRKEIIKRKFPPLRPKTNNSTPPPPTTNTDTTTQPQRTYAQVTKESSGLPTNSNLQQQSSLENLFMQTLTKMENMMTTFMDNVNNLTKLITTLLTKML